jgi:hypothetical protein
MHDETSRRKPPRLLRIIINEMRIYSQKFDCFELSHLNLHVSFCALKSAVQKEPVKLDQMVWPNGLLARLTRH